MYEKNKYTDGHEMSRNTVVYKVDEVSMNI